MSQGRQGTVGCDVYTGTTHLSALQWGYGGVLNRFWVAGLGSLSTARNPREFCELLLKLQRGCCDPVFKNLSRQDDRCLDRNSKTSLIPVSSFGFVCM